MISLNIIIVTCNSKFTFNIGTKYRQLMSMLIFSLILSHIDRMRSMCCAAFCSHRKWWTKYWNNQTDWSIIFCFWIGKKISSFGISSKTFRLIDWFLAVTLQSIYLGYFMIMRIVILQLITSDHRCNFGR